MDQNNYIIRLETSSDYTEVENLIRESFWNVYRPGCIEHYVMHCIRSDKDFVPELDFVMEKDNKIIGQNAFMRACIQADDGRLIPIMTMGPICISSKFRKKGYGKILLEYSINAAKNLGVGALCLEGDIRFYKKSGFIYASEYGIRYKGLPPKHRRFFLFMQRVDSVIPERNYGRICSAVRISRIRSRRRKIRHAISEKRKIKTARTITVKIFQTTIDDLIVK